MLIKILIAIAVLIAAFLVVAALQPTEITISRSAFVAAPPSAVFPHVNTARSWEAWSPWSRLDPTMKTTYEGPAAGVGAVTAWTSSGQAGAGSTTVIASEEGKLVRFRLEMLEPMRATNTVDFTFKPERDGTVITWAMHCRRNLLAKAFGLFIDCDKMVGGEFEKGLANLGAVVKRRATVPSV